MAAAVTRHGARVAGFVAGLLIVAAVAWHAWRVPASAAPVELEVTVAAAGDAELAVEPAGDVLAGALRAGARPAEGLLHVRNQTATTLALRPVLRGGDPVAGAALHVELTRRGERLFRGPAAGLRGSAAATVSVPSGERAGMRVRAWVPAGTDAARLGTGARWNLSFAAEAVR